MHVEIGLPDEEGRVQILNIHTGEMRKNGLLSPEVSITDLASRTKNYTGAELEGLVKAAASYVFQRAVDPNDLSKVNAQIGSPGMMVRGGGSSGLLGGSGLGYPWGAPVRHDLRVMRRWAKHTPPPPHLLSLYPQVTKEDFERALGDLQPQFGVREDELARAFAGGIVHTGPEFDRVHSTLHRLVEQVKTSERTSLMSVLLTGPSGSGKSALAAKLALDSGFPFVKRISGESLLNLHEGGKADAIARVFNDAHKSPLSLIILDDIERLIEYVSVGPRFSNVVLQTLLVLTKALPPRGRKLMIVGTTAIPELLDQMELASGFQLSLGVPLVSDEAEYLAVLREVGRMSPRETASVAGFLAGKPLGIKKLLAIVDMARDHDAPPDSPITEEQFLAAVAEWGL